MESKEVELLQQLLDGQAKMSKNTEEMKGQLGCIDDNLGYINS